MSMIKKSHEIYEKFREPRRCRLRRSSRRPDIESEYVKIYNMEEHILYRKQEIASIHQTYQYYKMCDELIYWLSKICGVYSKESGYDLLGCYIIGEAVVEDGYESKKIMECRLNLKDKDLTKGEIYVMHCANLPEMYSYLMLTQV